MAAEIAVKNIRVAEDLDGIQREQHHRRDACVPIGFGNFGRNVKQPARKKIPLGRFIFARLGRAGQMDGRCTEFRQHNAARRTRGRQRLIGRQRCVAAFRADGISHDSGLYLFIVEFRRRPSIPASPSRRRVSRTILDSSVLGQFSTPWSYTTFSSPRFNLAQCCDVRRASSARIPNDKVLSI